MLPVVLLLVPVIGQLGVERIANIPSLLRNKTELLSVYVETLHGGDEIIGPVVGQALANNIPVFFQQEKAFERFRFTLIVPSVMHSVSPGLVHAIWQHTVPLYNGFFQLSTMFANGVVAWNEDRETFNITQVVKRVTELNSKIRFLWSYQQILQEVIWYRYGSPDPLRLAYTSKILGESQGKPSLAVVGIYSAGPNGDLRDAIRATWGRILHRLGIEVLFFLSSPGEAKDNPDVVLLDVADGYKNNSRKGVVFLKWISENRSKGTRFLIKTDDDIFWNPEPLLRQLALIEPVGYVWGFVDYISPVPRNETDAFYNDPTIYPFPTFPTYPRGLVRILSMDIVQAIAQKASRRELRMIYGDDPAFGVHLRQIRADHSVPYIRIDDFASYKRFAMTPTCAQSAWRPVTNDTWIIHHVNAPQIYCLHQSHVFPNCSCF